MTRLFVAVWPPDDLLDRLADLERPRDRGVRWVPRENLHVTLRFLGDADEDDAIERLDAVTLPAADLALGPAVDVLSDHSLVIPVAGADELAGRVTRALRGIGTARQPRHFVGHLTVARLARGARPARAAGARFEGSFRAEQVSLVASTLTEAGAVYDTVASWPTC